MTDTKTDQVRDAARQTFRDHLEYLSSGRIPEWVELFSDEGVLEFPYGPEGFPKAVSGKAELFDYMQNFPKHFEAPQVLCRSYTGCGSRLRAA